MIFQFHFWMWRINSVKNWVRKEIFTNRVLRFKYKIIFLIVRFKLYYALKKWVVNYRFYITMTHIITKKHVYLRNKKFTEKRDRVTMYPLNTSCVKPIRDLKKRKKSPLCHVWSKRDKCYCFPQAKLKTERWASRVILKTVSCNTFPVIVD